MTNELVYSDSDMFWADGDKQRAYTVALVLYQRSETDSAPDVSTWEPVGMTRSAASAMTFLFTGELTQDVISLLALPRGPVDGEGG